MKGNGKPRVNMAMALLNLLTFKSTQRQIIDSQTRDALGLALAQGAPRTRDRAANKKGYRQHAKNPAGTKLLRAVNAGRVTVRHVNRGVDAFFLDPLNNHGKSVKTGRRLGV